jgi:hypothetical protein
LGVIDSLSAGYRVLGKRLDLLLTPLLLDLMLWLAPRLSIAPIFRQLAGFYTDAAQVEGMSADMSDMSRQVADMLSQSGANSNLLNVLVNTSLLHVPSLLTYVGTPGDNRVIEVGNLLAALLLFVGFGLLGILIGVVYLNQLVRLVPLGSAPKPTDAGEFIGAVLRHWWMVVLYVVLIVLTLTMVSIPAALATALLTLISPVIGSLLVLVLSGAILVILFYLYFVTIALIMDNLSIQRAIVQSFRLVRGYFWATLGFVMIYNLISLGFALLMANIAMLNPITTILAILIYAYIGTGLTLALLVFYRTRILKQEERTPFPGVA